MDEILHDWNAIAKDYADADVLLGNGFSISFHSQFTYSSLFERFCSQCAPQAASIFRGFDTVNFEEIQNALQNAIRVNQLLSVEAELHQSYVRRLRDGLIETINNVHPPSEERDQGRLVRITQTLEQFNDIYSLNYDLYLYDIIMIAKNQFDSQQRPFRYNDYFWGEHISGDREFRSTQTYNQYKYVFYLHGALFLYHDDLNVSCKVVRNGEQQLIDTIGNRIRSGRLPLFVAEGSAQDKVRTINRSIYLRFALDKFRSSKRPCVIFGASLGASDEHIASALRESRNKLAVSVFSGSRDKNDIRREMHDIRGRLWGVEVTFFNSSTLFA